MIALLIDADNLSSPEWVDEAVRILERREGEIAIRRAYGSPEKIKALAAVLQRHAIRPFVNQPVSKNTTDVSLAIDAMEIACMSPNLTRVVIGSGDMDFVPLAVRLREKGLRVVCVSVRNTMAQETKAAYHEVIHVGASPAPAPHAAGKSAQPQDAQPVPADKPREAPAKPPAKAPTHEEIIRVLPDLTQGKWLQLSDVVKTLRDEKLLARNGSSTRLFTSLKQHFELKPASKPNQVRLIK